LLIALCFCERVQSLFGAKKRAEKDRDIDPDRQATLIAAPRNERLATYATMHGAPLPQNSALTSAGVELFIPPRRTLPVKFAPGSQTYAGSGTLHYTW
jgi:hypothetical protein